MTTQTINAPATDPEVTTTSTDMFATPGPGSDALAERLLAATLGAMELTAVYLGDRLGWYRALAEAGPLSSAELAGMTGTAERYAREWLEHQAASGYLEVLDTAAHHSSRRFRLRAGAADVLLDVDSLSYTAPLARLVAASGRVIDSLVEAYRTGGGVGWSELGADAREAQSAMNRPLFLHRLTQEILPGVPELHARLAAGAHVADIGCGEGWSAIGLALGYPQVTVDGFDIDGPSVDAARRHATASGVADRVRFATVDAASRGEDGARYDVVMAYECVHDMGDPVAVLRAMRGMVAPDGYVLVVDERAQEDFTAPADPVERLFYGYSLICCLPDGLSHENGVGTGTVMRPDVLAGYATRAGFARVEVLPVEHEAFRFYRLHL
ncbi:methyltransferase domain-containing protein [Cellulomonas sp. APG4]|uniref:class I SAM-dependent methyltransferase n=1 Tax=Cellulomonas sp. APG4 TaxID=1538656 RepID=UPI00137B4797|nr:class I SAM-dependent methyltransferase [Cellulomonas sp. APG4]NCT89874.1 methyltransferase domain-containing protein [Cellulomonas sp. APG4]